MVDPDGHETALRDSDTFDSLVATAPAGPSRIDPSMVLDFSDRPARERKHTSPLEWAGLVLAVILPPLGLLVTVVARIVIRRRHGWTTGVAVAATVISIVLTLVLAGGAVYLKSVSDADAAAEALLAEAAPLCEAIAATPDVLDTPAYGWPTDVAALPVTLEAMKAYQAHWAELAQLAPASAQTNVAAIADQAQILVSAVESSQIIDRAGNLAIMSTITDASGLPGWVTRNCS
ncbi:uncharacterized membrane protein YqaE (UPF0057 family) [Conyzicola lurida]|uniref:Uncharacterized membrane protein YqaE (UPF0057 family) n=1 Tax=Conyzicola lurida TaxID=1172621 RepID=A0A841AJ71_9MICO|nr:hypothetical protein [Conyzicola lurida]MBB5842378.1 uncharacterized membrane protein YqaE (UPF0057 family) [Conyzicola lurida]